MAPKAELTSDHFVILPKACALVDRPPVSFLPVLHGQPRHRFSSTNVPAFKSSSWWVTCSPAFDLPAPKVSRTVFAPGDPEVPAEKPAKRSDAFQADVHSDVRDATLASVQHVPAFAYEPVGFAGAPSRGAAHHTFNGKRSWEIRDVRLLQLGPWRFERLAWPQAD
jgi:hypothetical protein